MHHFSPLSLILLGTVGGDKCFCVEGLYIFFCGLVASLCFVGVVVVLRAAAAAARVPPGQTVSWTQTQLLLLLPPPPRGPARCGADGAGQYVTAAVLSLNYDCSTDPEAL